MKSGLGLLHSQFTRYTTYQSHYLFASSVWYWVSSFVDRFMHSCIDSSPLPLHRKVTFAGLLLFYRDTYAHVVCIVPLPMISPIPVLSYLNSPSTWLQ